MNFKAVTCCCLILSVMTGGCSGKLDPAQTIDISAPTLADFDAIMTVYNDSQNIAGAGPQHGQALVGGLKYKPGFTHLDYVNPEPPKGGTVTFTSIGNFDSLNPFIVKGNGGPGLGLIFDTLMDSTQDEPSSQYGLIAESIEIPADKSSVTFTLRPEARWQDNTAITPDDVIFTFQSLIKDGKPFYLQYYNGVDSVRKTGERKVTFVFKKGSNSELPFILGELPVLSKKYYDTHTFNAPTLDPPAGSGPYIIEDVKAGKSITYLRNPDYWADDLPIMKGRYNFERIHYIVYQDENVRFQGFLAGEYDVHIENISKRWATEYTGRMFDNRVIVKELIPNRFPQGLQGFVFNTRRDIFKNRTVREALAYAYDHEWSNKNLFFGFYTRTKSYFENSVFASYLEGLPSKKELELLEPLKGKIPDEVFTKVYTPPSSDGTGNIRSNLNRAIKLLEEAGWTIQDTKLTNRETGKQMRFEIMLDSASFERVVAPFVKNLEKLGINATYRTIDVAQGVKREQEFDFDMIVNVWGESFSPGNEQKEFWGSKAAEQIGSRNFAGIKDPAIDALIDAVISAQGIDNLKAATRALDRVLLWNHFVIPQHFSKYNRIAYRDRFAQPEKPPAFGIAYTDTWWIDPVKDAAIKNK